MSEKSLLLVAPGTDARERFAKTLESALRGRRLEITTALSENDALQGRRILFAVPLPGDGINPGFYQLLSTLRRSPDLLAGCTAGVMIDGENDLYTKAAARELVAAANGARCRFPGRPLVEATGGLQNFTVQAKNADCSLEEAYQLAVGDLAERIVSFAPPLKKRPKLCVLHASSRQTSNTLALWSLVREHLESQCDITEIGLRNGTLEDCGGCPYTTCLHFGEKGGCFYGGVMVQEVYPAIRECDAVILLCPNYNDALSANLTAAVNRLTALYRTTSFAEKAVFGIVVSGYSGGDIVESQLISSLCMNKGFWLPSRFAMLETANNAGTAVRLPGIHHRAAAFAERILTSLTGQGSKGQTIQP